jgi:hypothetical protein
VRPGLSGIGTAGTGVAIAWQSSRAGAGPCPGCLRKATKRLFSIAYVRRLRLKARGRWAALGAAGGTALAVVAFACIPDLPQDSGSDGGAPDAGPEGSAPTARCGDGIIQIGREQCDPGVTLAPDATPVFGCTPDCQMVCDGYVWPQNDHCYSVAKATASDIQVASSNCGQTAHVVTFASESELGAVLGSLDAGRAFWVGVTPYAGEVNGYGAFAAFEPGWSPACPGCYAHTADAQAPLPGGPPPGEAAYCVEAMSDPDASWQQYPCSGGGKIGVICEREPVGGYGAKCDGGVCIDLVWTFGTKRYVYVSTRLSATDAEAHCNALGGTLVVLQSRDEREQLWFEVAKLIPPDAFWIGLSLRGGAWVWDDDAGVDTYVAPWAEGQPGAGAQATLSQTTEQPQPVDDTLATSSAGTALRPSVCQIATADAGP